MNVVVSLIAREHDEKRVIRFKKVPASDTTSEFRFCSNLVSLEIRIKWNFGFFIDI